MRQPMRPFLIVLPLVGLFACQSTTRVGTDGSSASPAPRPPPPASAPPASTPAASKPPPPRPTTKAGCDACQGKWERHGIAEAESCICKTKDGGKTCKDGADCEGACIVADDAKFEVAVPGNPPKGFYVGRCADYDTTFGCYRLISKGATKDGPVAADDLAHRLCVD